MINKVVKKSLILKTGTVALFLLCLFYDRPASAGVREDAVRFRIRGYQFQYRGQLKEAIVNYQKAIETDPTYAAPHNDLGLVYESSGWAKKAEKEFLQALQLDSHFVDPYFNLASLYEKSGEKEKAIAYFRKRVDLGEPADIETQKARVELERLEKEAVAPAQPSVSPPEPPKAPVEREKSSATVKRDKLEEAVRFRIRGYQLQHRGLLEEAIENYQKAIQADPTYAAPHNDLGIIYVTRGRNEKAEQEFLETLQLDPKYLDALFNLASLYEQRGDRGKAIAYLQKRVELGKAEDVGTQEAQARLDRLTDQRGSSALPPEVSLPPSPVQPATRGEIILTKPPAVSQTPPLPVMKPVPAESGERETVPVDPAVELRNKALALQKTGNLDAAAGAYQKALKLRPNFSTVHNDLGILYEDQGKLEEAEESYQKALSINPDYRLARYNLALLYEKQGRFSDAIPPLEHFILHSDYEDPWTKQAHRRLNAIRAQIAHQEQIRLQEEEKVRLAALEAERKQQEETALREKIRQEVEGEENRKRTQQVSELFEKGKKAVRDKRSDEALEAFEALLVLDPQNKVGQEYYQKLKKQEADQQRQTLEARRQQMQRERLAHQKEKETKLTELFEQGKKAYQKKQYPEALQAFEAMLLVDPDTQLAKEYLQKTKERIQEEEARASEEEKRRLAELQQKIEEEKIEKEHQEKRRKEAEEAYEEAKGRFRDGDLKGALKLFEDFLLVEPDHSYAKRYVERIHEKMKEQEGQIASAFAQGEEALQKADYEKAIADFNEVLMLDSSHAQAKEKRNLAQQSLEKRRQQAHAQKEGLKVERLRQAQADRQERAKGLAKLSYQEGMKRVKEGRNAEALEAFEKTLRLDPAYPGAEKQVARMQERLAFEETKAWRAKKEETYHQGFVKEESKLLYHRALAAYEAGDLVLAKDTLEYLLVLIPDHPYARADLEKIEKQLRAVRQKLAVEKASLKRETRKELKIPLVPIEHAQQAPLSRSLPRMQEAPLEIQGETFLEGEGAAHDLMKRIAKGYASKGSSMLAMDDIDGAIAYYEKAEGIDRSPQVANTLGILYERKGMLEKAERAYREAVVLDDKFLAAHTNLALLYERMGRLEEAGKHWKIRADLGLPDDLWTQRARTHLDAQKNPLTR